MDIDRARRILHCIMSDSRYLANLDYGKPRGGHPEGTARAHIEEISRNLEKLRSRLSQLDALKVLILIHVHDSFKAESQQDVAITHPRSHASLARSFLAEFLIDPTYGVPADEADLLHMVQFHDEPYALWRQNEFRGHFNPTRLSVLLSTIKDWNLFIAFQIIDGCTVGKDRRPLEWLFDTVGNKVTSTFTAEDIIAPEEVALNSAETAARLS